MSRILILANNDVGLYKFRKELIEELLNNHKVFISLPNGKLIKDLVDLGCIFIETKISRRGTNPLVDLKLLMEYKKILNSIKPDVVLTYTIKPNIYGGIVCGIAKKAYIVNITGLGTAVENSGGLQCLTIFLYKLALKSAACVFFQNTENAKFMNSRNLIKGRQQVIPGSGVNLKYYNVLEYPRGEVVKFLFVSRVMKQKGIEQYIDMATYIRKKYPKTEFHILGFCEEAYEKKLMDLQEKNIVQYHGMCSDVIPFYRDSHCIIHPSYYPEGMSNVLLESASSGRPVITTNRSGCREIVDDGITGYLIEPKSTEELIEKVEMFLLLNRKEKKRMGYEGRKKVVKAFDRRIVVEKYLEEINSVF